VHEKRPGDDVWLLARATKLLICERGRASGGGHVSLSAFVTAGCMGGRPSGASRQAARAPADDGWPWEIGRRRLRTDQTRGGRLVAARAAAINRNYTCRRRRRRRRRRCPHLTTKMNGVDLPVAGYFPAPRLWPGVIGLGLLRKKDRK